MFCDSIIVVKEKVTIICKLYEVHLYTTHLDNSSCRLQTLICNDLKRVVVVYGLHVATWQLSYCMTWVC